MSRTTDAPTKSPETKNTGRPTSFTPEVGDRICELIAQGNSMVKICAEVGVGYSTVTQWLRDEDDAEKEAFQANYARAREDQADFHADRILEIADDSMLPPDDRRVKIDARKWIAGKMRPKRYGEKLQHTGEGGGPIKTDSVVQIYLPANGREDPA